MFLITLIFRLIKYSPESESDSGESVNDEWSVVKPAQVKIAAIGKQLFVCKHAID